LSLSPAAYTIEEEEEEEEEDDDDSDHNITDTALNSLFMEEYNKAREDLTVLDTIVQHAVCLNLETLMFLANQSYKVYRYDNSCLLS
jgi:hypothetical protein